MYSLDTWLRDRGVEAGARLHLQWGELRSNVLTISTSQPPRTLVEQAVAKYTWDRRAGVEFIVRIEDWSVRDEAWMEVLLIDNCGSYCPYITDAAKVETCRIWTHPWVAASGGRCARPASPLGPG